MADFEDGSIVPVDPAAPAVDAPVDPAVAPTDVPTDTPVADPTVDPAVAPVDVPVDSPVDPAIAPTDVPTDAPVTDEPAPTDVPVEDGISFDKDVYAPGEIVTATVKLASQLKVRTVTYTPANGETLTASFSVQENIGSLSDDGNGEWALVEGSYEGDTAQFTTTA